MKHLDKRLTLQIPYLIQMKPSYEFEVREDISLYLLLYFIDPIIVIRYSINPNLFLKFLT